MPDVVVRTPTSCPGEIAGVLSAVFGAARGGLEAIARAWARKIPLKWRRIRPIRNGSDGNAREVKVETAIGLGGLVGVALLALAARASSRRRRASIRGMLSSSRACAVRTDG